jgi:hypothetical protein
MDELFDEIQTFLNEDAATDPDVEIDCAQRGCLS